MPESMPIVHANTDPEGFLWGGVRLPVCMEAPLSVITS